MRATSNTAAASELGQDASLSPSDEWRDIQLVHQLLTAAGGAGAGGRSRPGPFQRSLVGLASRYDGGQVHHGAPAGVHLQPLWKLRFPGEGKQVNLISLSEGVALVTCRAPPFAKAAPDIGDGRSRSRKQEEQRCITRRRCLRLGWGAGALLGRRLQ